MKLISQKYSNYFLITLLVLVGGNPHLQIPILYGILGVISLLFSLQRKDFVCRFKLWYFIIFFIVLFFLQILNIGSTCYLGYINFLAKIIFGATVMWITKEKFRYMYLDVIYVCALISLVFIIPKLIWGFDIPDLFPTTPERNSIFIYCSSSSTSRNSGPFWEPGAFACYLLLIPILFYKDLPQIVRLHKFKFIVLLIALITTTSTTGFIVLALVAVYYLTLSKYKFVAYTFMLPIMLFLIVAVYNENDFLRDKIVYQFEDSQNLYGAFSNTRMGSLMFDMHYIFKHPLIGNGLDETTRYADHPFLWGKILGHGNGFSNFTSQMGILAILLYFILLFKNTEGTILCKLMTVISFLLLLQGEGLLNIPLFLSLPFVIYKKTINKIPNNKKYYI